MSKNKRPPFEGLYIYAFLTLLAFIVADLAILKTQLYLEGQTTPKTPGTNFRRTTNPGVLSVRSPVTQNKYQTIADRNLFNSDGIIPPPWGGTEEIIDDNDTPVKTDLPIEVIGTLVHANPYRSIASVSLQGEENPAALKVGDFLKDLAEILAVFRRRVIFRNLKSQRLEFVEIPEEPKAVSRRSQVQTPKYQRPGLEPAIKQAGNDFTVSRADVKEQLNNYQSLLKTARAIPYKDPRTGELTGFKVTQLQPGSLFQKLGIQPGDVIKGVNGEPINSVNKALEVFANLKGSVDDISNVDIRVERGGSDQSLKYNLSD